jgi:hypothetical protein
MPWKSLLSGRPKSAAGDHAESEGRTRGGTSATRGAGFGAAGAAAAAPGGADRFAVRCQ